MASGIASDRPQAASAPTQGRFEDFIQKRLEHTRRQVRLVDVLSGLMLLASSSLLFFLAVAVLDHWVFNRGLSFLARLGLFAVWIATAGAFVWRFLVPPLANRINPVFAAQTIEHGRPTLKNSLINFLLLRSHPQDVAPVVFRAMEHQAATDLLKVPVDHALDRDRVVHLAYVLAAVVGVFALYLALSPKNPLLSAARVLWPWSSVPAPTRVHIEEISPGDKNVFNDDREPISAVVSGLRDGEEVALLVSTAESQVVDDRIVMARADDANHYRCELPSGSDGFQRDTFYRITAGDATTRQYKLEFHTAPMIGVDSLDYHFPPYTGQADRSIKNQGDIKALEGTEVTIHATANMAIKEARIDLNCAGLQTLSMTTTGTKATGQFTLALNPDAAGKPEYNSYQILFTDFDGHAVRRPARYRIEVDRDLPPTIAIVEPSREDVAMAENGQLRIRVHALDPDFALRRVTLEAEREGEKLGLPVLLDRTKPDEAFAKPFDGEYLFRPANLKLKAGDVVTYWATADDNKEPHANHSESTPRRTIRIVAGGQGGQRDPQNQPGQGDKQPDETKAGQNGERSKTGKGGSDPSGKAEESNGEENTPGQKSGHSGQRVKTQQPKPGDGKNQDQSDKSDGQGQQQSSSDRSNGANNGDPNSGEAGNQPREKISPDVRRTEAIQEMIKDKAEQDARQQNQSGGDQKPDQNRDAGPQADNQQTGGQQPNGGNSGQQPSGYKGGQQPQSNPGQQKNQGGNADDQKSPGGNPKSGQNTGQSNSGQGSRQKPGGQGNQDGSPQQGNSTSQSNGGSKPQGTQNSAHQSPGDKSLQSSGAGQGNEPKSPAGSNQDKNSGGSPKPDAKRDGGEKGLASQSAAGDRSKTEKRQPGSEQGKNDATGGDKSPKTRQQPGAQGGGDEKQIAQGGSKDGEKKPSTGSSGPGSPNTTSEKKPGEQPKGESGTGQGGSRDAKSKPEEKPAGSGQAGDQRPKPGQGDKEGSNGGGNKPDHNKPGENKGGTADSEPGQKSPGKSGGPTPQESAGAPKSQVDREKGQPKPGDAQEGLNPKSDNPQSPSISPHDSNSNSDTRGHLKGGGGTGGGQPEKKTGKGAAGSETSANSGGSASKEHGEGVTGDKAGNSVRSTDRTDSPHKEQGKGSGEKKPDSAENPAANDNSQPPQGDPARNPADSQEKSSGGSSPGAQSSQSAGKQGSGLPAGGSAATASNPTSASPPPPGEPDPASLEFSKNQVDLALEHLKDQLAKQKPELLDRLGWTKEEGQKFLENMRKLKDSAQQSGSEGEAGKKAYKEVLKNLDLHPHGTRIGGGQTKTDDLRRVRDSGQMEPPSEYYDRYRAYSHATAGEK